VNTERHDARIEECREKKHSREDHGSALRI